MIEGSGWRYQVSVGASLSVCKSFVDRHRKWTLNKSRKQRRLWPLVIQRDDGRAGRSQGCGPLCHNLVAPPGQCSGGSPCHCWWLGYLLSPVWIKCLPSVSASWCQLRPGSLITGWEMRALWCPSPASCICSIPKENTDWKILSSDISWRLIWVVCGELWLGNEPLGKQSAQAWFFIHDFW